MSCPVNHEELEDYARDHLPETRAAELRSHVARCSSCRDELDWLRLEQMAFEERRSRGDDVPAALWAGIEARLGDASEAVGTGGEASPRGTTRLGGTQRAVWFGSGFAAAAMAAAVLLLYVRAPGLADPEPRPVTADAAAERAAERAAEPSPAPTGSAAATLAEAESQYADAIAALEAEYSVRRADLPDDIANAHAEAFERGRDLIEAARRDAGDDVEARMLVLDAYSAHLRTVQAVMTTME